MQSDRYLRVVLTVIAVCLVWICLRDVVVVKPAYAYGSGQEVKVTNYETDVKGGETLYVYCKNCK
jgi:hypothetical protein